MGRSLRVAWGSAAMSLAVALSNAFAATNGQTGMMVSAAACVVSVSKSLDLKAAGPNLHVWTKRGSIPGTSGGPKGHVFQMFIRTGSRRGELHTFVVTPNGIGVAEDFFALAMPDSSVSWAVVDGNGGPSTYEAVSKYVNRLVREEPEQQIDVAASHGMGCFLE